MKKLCKVIIHLFFRFAVWIECTITFVNIKAKKGIKAFVVLNIVFLCKAKALIKFWECSIMLIIITELLPSIFRTKLQWNSLIAYFSIKCEVVSIVLCWLIFNLTGKGKHKIVDVSLSTVSLNFILKLQMSFKWKLRHHHPLVQFLSDY